MKFDNVTNVFDLQIFDNETAALLKFFEICTEMHSVSSFFLSESNIKTSLLMTHLKCTVVHYADLNLSSIYKPLLNYCFVFFDSLFMFILTRLLSKTL